MPYAFSNNDGNVQGALRRIAGEQVGKAIAEIDDTGLPQAEKIHQLRKRCKKLRGLIRLVRPAFGDYRLENARIRDAARALSALRDNDVLVETLDALLPAGDGPDMAGFASVRERLTTRRGENRPKSDVGEPLSWFREEMAATLARVGGWRLSAKGFAAMAGGLENTYGRGRKTYRAARSNPSPENLHEWRKRVKYHGYHARLLAPVWVPVMAAHIEEANRLGELLGDHRNLSVFMAMLAGEPAIAGNRQTLESLRALARERQSMLETEAFGIAARLFAERPDALVRRWRACWKSWRKETGKAHSRVVLAAE